MTDNQSAPARRPLLVAGAAALASACGAAWAVTSGPGSRGGAARPAAAGRTAPPPPAAPRAAALSGRAVSGDGRPADPDATARAASAPGPAPTAPEYYVHAGAMALALTFDDGPSPVYTPEVLSILRQYRVTATFFMIGLNAARYPDTVRQVVEEGHTVGNHTWTHPDLGTLTRPQVRTELERTGDLLARLCGGRPSLFRAPGGFFTHATMDLCGELGLRPVSWSVDPEDWANPGADAIAQRVLRHARTGSIVLDHDGCLTDGAVPAPGGPADRSQTVTALRHYLPRLVDAGFRFTVPDAA
ncbi:polysaccharide deacetylase family protein [Streptacidiphilus sp. PB12-B1b]|uniref:polysaccharide deacetylase family protein n=1 Tax=Streptacidiphilus sp. PB12-B1b TaxID=2705012 RepID=UPI0015F8B272|nr:polysaccharide deacetylase family protein [Streptacidiphilus sp. PB12-B1b]QMU77854.1 polysaccharide deacetylase family protein [Streptacidiphilus sp. PB12-B1b]